MIGIVGGMGPLAGLDLQRKIIEQTLAERDQEHLAVISLSQPAPLPDRTAYLLGETADNPAQAIADQLQRLAQAGATVAGLACNTAHAPPIFNVIRAQLETADFSLILLHMIEEVARHLQHHHPRVQGVGLLTTTGSYRTRLYPSVLAPMGIDVLVPDESVQNELVHTAVYHPRHGIKTQGQATDQARQNLLAAVAHLQTKGVETIVLGCTEMPLALPGRHVGEVALVDSTLVLARALIREAAPDKLRPWPI